MLNEISKQRMNKNWLYILILFSCHNSQNALDEVYSKLESNLKNKDVIEFSNLTPEEIIRYEPFLNNEFINGEYNRIQQNKSLYLKEFKRKGIPQINNIELFLVIFHLKLNETQIDSNSIANYFKNINHRNNSKNELKSIATKSKRLNFISQNWKKYKIGDTILFELPIDRQKIITYGSVGQQREENPIFESSIILKGKLLNKYFSQSKFNSIEKIDSINSTFEIKLDSVGQNVFKSQFFGEKPTKCIKGDTFKLSLELYGNRIMN